VLCSKNLLFTVAERFKRIPPSTTARGDASTLELLLSVNGICDTVGTVVARLVTISMMLISVSDLPKISTRAPSLEFATRVICTESIGTCKLRAILARRASVAFSMYDALESTDTPASDPSTTTARGTIDSHTPEILMYPVTHQQSNKAFAAPDVDASA
jgi:hypothetical protein